MNRNKRRHKTGFSYIGAGNNTSVFNRKPNKVFSKIKYQLNRTSLKNYKLDYLNKKLTDSERANIKKEIRAQHRSKNILTLIISIAILIPTLYLIIALIQSVLNKYN